MVRSILVLVSALVNAEYVLCRPHSNSAKQISKRDIFPSIPIFNRVFRNRNPEGTPMSKFFGDDSSTFTNYDYIYQIPTWNDNNLEEYTGESDNDLEISSEESSEEAAKKTLPKLYVNKDSKANKKPDMLIEFRDGALSKSVPLASTEMKKDLMNTINLNPIKNSRDCEPEFQIATQEQKMLKYFSNSEPKPDQNKNELHNPCVPYSPDSEKNRDTLAQFDNQIIIDFVDQPAPLEKQPNALLRDDLIEDSPDDPLEEEETQNNVIEEKEKNDPEKLKNIDIVFPPNTSEFEISKRFKNEANSEVSLENNDSDIEDPEEMNGFHFRFPVRIIPYTAVVERFTTPEPQKNPTMSFEMNEPENSRMNSNKTEATTNSHTYELKRNTTVRPQFSDNTRNTKDIFKSSIEYNIERNATGILSKLFKDLYNGIVEKIQEHPNNLRKDEVKNISDANLTIWSSPNKTKTGKPTTTTPHVHSIEKNKPTNHNNDRRPEKTDFRKIWKPSLDTDKNAIANSILSRIFGTVLTSSIEKMKSPKRSRRDIHFNSNRYLSKIVLNNIAKKYIAPKHFPKSDRNLFSITEGSAVQTPPAGFREKNESILRNIVVPDTAENEVMTLADIFNGNYARGVKSKKLKDFSEDFEQIM